MKLKKHIIFNRAVAENGWIHIVPKGDVKNAEAGIVQVLDDQSLDAMMANIAAERTAQGDKWPGIYGGREHFIYDATKDSSALAWFKDFEKRDDGIWAKEDGLTPNGVTAVKNREYKYTSFCADPADLKPVTGTKNHFRVLKLETVGFTNFANGKHLLSPITNRSLGDLDNLASPGGLASDQNQTIQNKMKNIATALGLDANTDEQGIVAVVTKLMNRGEISATDLATLKNRSTELEAQNKDLLDGQIDGLLAEHKITDTKVINRLKPSLATLKNRDERIAYITDLGLVGKEAAAPLKKVLNRGAGNAVKQEESAEGQDEEVIAKKITNRANELKVAGRTFDSAWKQAQAEVLGH